MAPVPFGGATMFNRLCRLTRQPTLLRNEQAVPDAVRGFRIEALCNRGRATRVADAQHGDRPGDRSLAHHDRITCLDFPGWFGDLFVDLNTSLVDLIPRQ